jgi:hypothetical protein
VLQRAASRGVEQLFHTGTIGRSACPRHRIAETMALRCYVGGAT